jgi:DNA-binding response OmpR family regulator
VTCRILAIEDDRGIRAVLERGLRMAGHDVVLADTLAVARAAWRSDDAHDLVLLDVMLPDGDGLALLRERREAGDPTPTVLLTAREEAELGGRAADAGADAYLPKPFAYRDLLACIDRFAGSGRG